MVASLYPKAFWITLLLTSIWSSNLTCCSNKVKKTTTRLHVNYLVISNLLKTSWPLGHSLFSIHSLTLPDNNFWPSVKCQEQSESTRLKLRSFLHTTANSNWTKERNLVSTRDNFHQLLTILVTKVDVHTHQHLTVRLVPPMVTLPLFLLKSVLLHVVSLLATSKKTQVSGELVGSQCSVCLSQSQKKVINHLSWLLTLRKLTS